MRSPRSVSPFILLAASLIPACSNKSQDATPNPSATPSASSSPENIPDAPPSPFSVVLESAKPLVFSGVGGGIAAANQPNSHLAMEVAGAEMSVGPMPEGLPTEGKILHFEGRLPGSLWLSFESPAEGKDAAKTPLFRLDMRKKTWKKWTDNWNPLLAPWSKHRLLSMSTSSGKLKIKVVEPFRDKPDSDWPSAKLGDEVCEKSLKIDGLTSWSNGDVFATGHCKAGGSSRKYVLLHWPVATAVAAAASASAGPTPAPPASASAAPEASAMPEHEMPTADILDGGAADAGEAPAPDIGVHGEVLVVPDAPAQIASRALAVHDDKDVWLLAHGHDGAPFLYRFDGKTITTEALPKPIDGEALAIGMGDDGFLWLVSTHEIWKRATTGEWEKIQPPTGHWREAGPKWDFSGVWAAKGDVWIAGKHTSTKAEHHVVLRLRPVKETLTMP